MWNIRMGKRLRILCISGILLLVAGWFAMVNPEVAAEFGDRCDCAKSDTCYEVLVSGPITGSPPEDGVTGCSLIRYGTQILLDLSYLAYPTPSEPGQYAGWDQCFGQTSAAECIMGIFQGKGKNQDVMTAGVFFSAKGNDAETLVHYQLVMTGSLEPQDANWPPAEGETCVVRLTEWTLRRESKKGEQTACEGEGVFPSPVSIIVTRVK